MKLLSIKTISLLAVLILTGCTPTREELRTADYGVPPLEYEATIKQYFDRTLRDPYSAHYNFEQPQRFWLGGGKSPSHFGYLVRVGVNAKNGYGGYTGEETYGFFFKNEQITRVLNPIDMSLLKLP